MVSMQRRGFFGLLFGGVVAVVAKVLGLEKLPVMQNVTAIPESNMGMTITPAMSKAAVDGVKGLFGPEQVKQADRLMFRKDAFTLGLADLPIAALPHPDSLQAIQQRRARAYLAWQNAILAGNDVDVMYWHGQYLDEVALERKDIDRAAETFQAAMNRMNERAKV